MTTLTQRINRYIMECKYNDVCVRHGVWIELIDTLWNVNIWGDYPPCKGVKIELIDTLWNVNLLDEEGLLLSIRN